jgi:hypothetical protein
MNYNTLFLGMIIGFTIAIVIVNHYNKAENDCKNSPAYEECMTFKTKD